MKGSAPGIRRHLPFAAAWAAVAAVTVLLGKTLLPDIGGPRVLVAVLAGETAVAAAFIIVATRRYLAPADRWEAALRNPRDGPFPPADGDLAPLAVAAGDRHARALDVASGALRDREERLRQVEVLRRDLEETKSRLEARIQSLRSIHDVSAAISATLDADELYNKVAGEAMRALGIDDFCLLLYNSERRRLVCRASAGTPPLPPGEFHLGPGEGISWKVFETGEPAFVPDVRAEPEFRFSGGRRDDVRSFLCVPLLSKGKAIGVLNVNHPEANAFDEETLATVRILSAHLATAIEHAEMFQFVKALADKDSLTLLYNHGAFHARLQVELERASRYGRPLSVIMLDLDGFKEINDTHGHLLGDRILVMTAGVLCAQLRKSDVAARYGGDEFSIILPETDLAAASAIAGRIAAGISEVHVDAAGKTIAFTASIGYATALPGGRNRESILNVADRLMYESKRRGRGGILGEQI